jgi:hypothetical protein
MEEKIVKKRGRKSKTDIVAKNVEIDYNKYEQHKIIHVKNKDPEIVDEPNANLLSDNLVDKYYEIEYSTKINKCWNCCKKITNVIGYPILYDNTVFYCYGDFCSFGCCARHLVDNNKNDDLWDKLHLLNVMYNKISNTVNQSVKIAPDRRLLKDFGGTLSNEKYNNNEEYETYDITLPPIIPVNHNLVKHNETISTDVTELRLYRKNIKKSQNNIFNTMNIKTLSS